MKKLVTSILALIVCMSVICPSMVFAVTPEVTVWEASSRIVVSGKVDAQYAGQNATLMLVDKSADLKNIQATDLGFLDQVKIEEGGAYKFSATIGKSISNYELRMKIAGEDITQSVINATTDNKMISAVFDVDRGITSADVNVVFSNELLVSGETYIIISAYYDAQNKMISADITEKANISAATLTSAVQVSTTYAEGAKTMKVFIWDSKEKVIPLCDSQEIDLTEPLTVACWGDSLTAGYGGDGVSYPSVLEELTGYTVHNLGVTGETSYTIAARQGALNLVVTESFVIPADTTEVEFKIGTDEGGIVVPRQRSRGGWDPCSIAGVPGSFRIDVNSDVNPRVLNWIKFTRAEAGEEVVVPAGTKLKVAAHDTDADINIFFTGTNGGWTKDNLVGNDNSDEMCQALCDLLQKQVDHTGKSKFIIIGLTNGSYTSYDNLTAHMEEQFGNNFLNVREYLVTEQAFIDAGLSVDDITDSDRARMAEGRIPMAFLLSEADTTHFNATGYTLIANCVYNKMKTLGYCK